MDNLVTAFHFAATQHSGQRRKNKEQSPYINHPIEVCYLLCETGVADINTLVAAVLHDTIEDTATNYNDLVDIFGQKVADIVKECSDDKSLPKVERKKLQIEHAKEVSPEAKQVKMADKYSNLKDLLVNPPESWSPEIVKGYMYWAYAVFQNLKGVNHALELKMMILFDSFGVKEENLKEELEKYYQLME